MENGISVIIPTYNREQFVKETIHSVLNQEYEGNLEIIISDDGSTDKTLEIAERFGNRIIVLRKPDGCKTQGVASTRNRGIKAANQTLICFLDSDDFFLPGHLDRMASELKNNPGLGFAFCRILEENEENGKKIFRKWTHNHILKNDIKNPVVTRSHVVHTNSFMFHRKVFDKVGFFNESYSNGEDGDMWMRISEQFKGSFVDHYGAVYRIQHGINQLTNNSKEQIRKCFLAIYESAITRYYESGQKDLIRIFNLKHIMLREQLRNNKRLYHLKYLKLICRYPLAFMSRFPAYYYTVTENKKFKNWYPLQKFTE